jgi:hypothetical protein
MDKLNETIADYVRFVYSWDQDDDGTHWSEKITDPTFNDYLSDGFKYSAVGNWECGFDIVEWYEGIGDYAENGHYKCGRRGDVVDLLDFTCGDHRQESLDFIRSYKTLSPEMVLREYACSYLYHMSVEDLRRLLKKSACS